MNKFIVQCEISYSYQYKKNFMQYIYLVRFRNTIKIDLAALLLRDHRVSTMPDLHLTRFAQVGHRTGRANETVSR